MRRRCRQQACDLVDAIEAWAQARQRATELATGIAEVSEDGLEAGNLREFSASTSLVVMNGACPRFLGREKRDRAGPGLEEAQELVAVFDFHPNRVAPSQERGGRASCSAPAPRSAT